MGGSLGGAERVLLYTYSSARTLEALGGAAPPGGKGGVVWRRYDSNSGVFVDDPSLSLACYNFGVSYI